MRRGSGPALLLRRTTALLGAALVLLLLSRVPYGLLREERVRAFGEARTTALVLERLPASAHAPGELRIRYRGPDGREREAVVPVRPEIWAEAAPGSGLQGFVARADPALCRVAGQVEAPLRIWLRNALGYAAR